MSNVIYTYEDDVVVVVVIGVEYGIRLLHWKRKKNEKDIYLFHNHTFGARVCSRIAGWPSVHSSCLHSHLQYSLGGRTHAHTRIKECWWEVRSAWKLSRNRLEKNSNNF